MCNMIKLNSSNIDSVEYNKENSVLSILFVGGGLYNYSGIPASVFQSLINAPSKGKFFHQHIKDIYPTHKVG